MRNAPLYEALREYYKSALTSLEYQIIINVGEKKYQ